MKLSVHINKQSMVIPVMFTCLLELVTLLGHSMSISQGVLTEILELMDVVWMCAIKGNLLQSLMMRI